MNLQGSLGEWNTLGRIVLVEARHEGGEGGRVRLVQGVAVHPTQPEADQENNKLITVLKILQKKGGGVEWEALASQS